jgi:hypothetical protein
VIINEVAARPINLRIFIIAPPRAPVNRPDAGRGPSAAPPHWGNPSMCTDATLNDRLDDLVLAG